MDWYLTSHQLNNSKAGVINSFNIALDQQFSLSMAQVISKNNEYSMTNKIFLLCRTLVFPNIMAYWFAEAEVHQHNGDCQIQGFPGNIPIVLEFCLSLDKCNVLQSTTGLINGCWHCTSRGANKEESMALCPRISESNSGWQYRSDTPGLQREGWHWAFPLSYVNTDTDSGSRKQNVSPHDLRGFLAFLSTSKFRFYLPFIFLLPPCIHMPFFSH